MSAAVATFDDGAPLSQGDFNGASKKRVPIFTARKVAKSSAFALLKEPLCAVLTVLGIILISQHFDVDAVAMEAAIATMLSFTLPLALGGFKNPFKNEDTKRDYAIDVIVGLIASAFFITEFGHNITGGALDTANHFIYENLKLALVHAGEGFGAFFQTYLVDPVLGGFDYVLHSHFEAEVLSLEPVNESVESAIHGAGSAHDGHTGHAHHHEHEMGPLQRLSLLGSFAVIGAVITMGLAKIHDNKNNPQNNKVPTPASVLNID